MGLANITVYRFNGTASQLYGGSVLNAFGSPQTGTLFDGDGVLSQTDDGVSTFSLAGGPASTIDYLGSGTVSLASLSLFGIPLVSLSPVPVVAFASQGSIWLMLPQGFPNLLGLNLSSLTASFAVNANQTYTLAGLIPCFVEGTLIATPAGNLPVEAITTGGSVLDVDGNVHEVIWKGQTAINLNPAPIDDDPASPVVFPKGCMGPDAPFKALRVSAQHRILVTVQGQRHFVKAKFFVGHQAHFDQKARFVIYHHIMTRPHIALLSNGLPTESFYPGQYALSNLHERQKRDLLAALDDQPMHLAYPELTKREAAALFAVDA